jgi:RNA polymerase sigma factor (sigma-70 family)
MSSDSFSTPTIQPQSQAVAHTDHDLLEACRRGDARAWEQLLHKYERLVFSVARTCGLTPEDAADITQVTFTYLLKSLDSVQDDRLGGWLSTVARRHSWRVRNRQQREVAEDIDSEAIQALFPQHAADNPIAQWELVEWVHESLGLLGARCQQLLIALYFDPKELSYREISENLGIREGSLGPTRARCLAQLRKILQQSDKK